MDWNKRPSVPYGAIGVSLYVCGNRRFVVPYEYTSRRDDQMSWKKTCYIHCYLNPSTTYRFHGPEPIKFLSDHLAIPSKASPWATANMASCLSFL